MSGHFIDCLIKEEGGRSWRLTGIYGWPEANQKKNTWELINNLGKDYREPWVLGGDFNEILQESEKRGGATSDFNSISAFRDCLDGNSLRDIESSCPPFTWSNKRAEGLIEEMLDRCVANSSWWSLFPNAFVDVLIWDSSDHIPIYLRLDDHRGDNRSPGGNDERLFKFEARWLQHEDFIENLQNA